MLKDMKKQKREKELHYIFILQNSASVRNYGEEISVIEITFYRVLCKKILLLQIVQ